MAQSLLIQRTIRTTRYVISRMRPDTFVNEHIPVVEGPNAHMLAMMAARNVADNDELDARGYRDFHRGRVEAKLVPFGLTVAGHFGNRLHEGYVRLLPQSPSEFADLKQEDFYAAAVKLKNDIAHKDTPKEIKVAAEPLVQELGAFVPAYATWKAKATALADAEKALDKALQTCLDAQTSLRKLIEAKFPRQRKVAGSYFPFVKAKAKAEVKAEGKGEGKGEPTDEAIAGSPGGDGGLKP
jgi:hypothetical protein